MTQITVKALSEEIGTPVDRLLEQLADAGISKKARLTMLLKKKNKSYL